MGLFADMMDEKAAKSDAIRRENAAHNADAHNELWVAPGATDLTFGSLLHELIRGAYQRVETCDPDAKHSRYTECKHCGGNDMDRPTGQRQSSALIKHDSKCLLAKHLPRLRAMADRGST